MEWFKGKAGQLIALASIIGILAGFGYTGATYVNRIEDLEAKVAAINKTIDESLLLWLREAEESISVIEVSVGKLQSKVDTMPDLSPVEGNISVIRVDLGKIELDLNSLEKQLEKLEDKDANPLAGL
jgi:uncharacterized coiled-coil protein SlyX